MRTIAAAVLTATLGGNAWALDVGGVNPAYDVSVQIHKYSPLSDVRIGNGVGDAVRCRGLFNHRHWNMKRTAVDFAGPVAEAGLRFAVPAAGAAPEVPMVIASSRRAEWIAGRLKTAAPNIANWRGRPDRSPFGQGTYVWYDPRWSGKRAFIVVHQAEYAYYTAQLQNVPDVRVIGCALHGDDAAVQYEGFGTSRYCAVKLMKYLGYRQAWFVDDDVAFVSGFNGPQGGNAFTLPDVERMQRLVTPSPVGIGFRAHSVARFNQNQVNDFVGRNLGNRIGPFTTNNANAAGKRNTNPALLQQVVLWDVAELSTAAVNFSPLFLSGKEDKALSTFLKLRYPNRLWQIRTGAVAKVQASADNNNPAPPDVLSRVTSLINSTSFPVRWGPGGAEQALKDYFSAHQQAGELPVWTTSKAKEQIMDACIAKGGDHVPPHVFADPIPATYRQQ